MASLDVNASELDRVNFEAARSQMVSWVTSIRTPMRQQTGNVVNFSPHPMQQLASNTCNNSWHQNLFELLDLKVNIPENVNSDIAIDVVITEDDVKDETVFWESAIVCYVLGMTFFFLLIK